MSQHDYTIANQTGLEFRADLNNALAAIVTNNSGAVAPTTTYPGMEWLDTSNSSSWVLKRRNSTDSAWDVVLTQQGISLTSVNTSEEQRTALGLGTSSVLNASNSSGDIPLSNATKNENLNADMLDGFHSSSFVRTISGISPDVNGNVVVDMSDKVNKSGDTMTGTLNIAGDLTVYRAAAPTTGVLWLGNTREHFLYFDGADYIMPNGNLIVNDVYTARADASFDMQLVWSGNTSSPIDLAANWGIGFYRIGYGASPSSSILDAWENAMAFKNSVPVDFGYRMFEIYRLRKL